MLFCTSGLGGNTGDYRPPPGKPLGGEGGSILEDAGRLAPETWIGRMTKAKDKGT